MATVALFELVGRWNQFLSVILYISDGSKYTLQVALQALVTEASATSGTSMITPNVRMAGIVIALLPLVLIYPLAQKYFTSRKSRGIESRPFVSTLTATRRCIVPPISAGFSRVCRLSAGL